MYKKMSKDNKKAKGEKNLFQLLPLMMMYQTFVLNVQKITRQKAKEKKINNN